MRVCCQCHRLLSHHDVLGRESQEMEAARRAGGLDGLRFLYYNCPQCGHDNIFLEVAQLPGETGQIFRERQKSLTRAVQEVGGVATTIRVVEQGIGQG